MSKFFSRVGHAGPSYGAERMPELLPLRKLTVSVFGLGCIGAASALEFARAGIGELRVLDHDFVDPGTIQRWPFGIQTAGLPKTAVVAEAINKDYPRTLVNAYSCRLGAVRMCGKDNRSDRDIVAEIVEATSLIYDATAEIGVQQFLADMAVEARVPYVGVHVTYGGWGGMSSGSNLARHKDVGCVINTRSLTIASLRHHLIQAVRFNRSGVPTLRSLVRISTWYRLLLQPCVLQLRLFAAVKMEGILGFARTFSQWPFAKTAEN